MESFTELTLVEGRVILGDRYMIGQESGFYSRKPEEGRQIMLFEVETLEALARDARIIVLPEEHRRIVTVEGVPLNHLVGRRFWLGETLLEATRLSTPCRHIEEILGKAVFDPKVDQTSAGSCPCDRGAHSWRQRDPSHGSGRVAVNADLNLTL